MNDDYYAVAVQAIVAVTKITSMKYCASYYL